jgi:hypothetical protein
MSKQTSSTKTKGAPRHRSETKDASNLEVLKNKLVSAISTGELDPSGLSLAELRAVQSLAAIWFALEMYLETIADEDSSRKAAEDGRALIQQLIVGGAHPAIDLISRFRHAGRPRVSSLDRGGIRLAAACVQYLVELGEARNGAQTRVAEAVAKLVDPVSLSDLRNFEVRANKADERAIRELLPIIRGCCSNDPGAVIGFLTEGWAEVTP